jgi:hypothetical protein
MSLPKSTLTTTCDIYRPFGAGSPSSSNVPCRLVPSLSTDGPIADQAWTHLLMVDPEVDLRDGNSRTAGQNRLIYADGDEVRVPSGAASPRFVVVWIESIEPETPREFKKAYLLRHTA